MLPQLLARLLESGWLPILFLASPTLGFLCVIYFFSPVPPVHSPDGIVAFPCCSSHIISTLSCFMGAVSPAWASGSSLSSHCHVNLSPPAVLTPFLPPSRLALDICSTPLVFGWLPSLLVHYWFHDSDAVSKRFYFLGCWVPISFLKFIP